ncbi:MAG TPA: hypothetical protein VD962_04065 [Rubricoccaceae bacterium]|nr:hypothetical protein [Rubricoccaceae bacterium]
MTMLPRWSPYIGSFLLLVGVPFIGCDSADPLTERVSFTFESDADNTLPIHIIADGMENYGPDNRLNPGETREWEREVLVEDLDLLAISAGRNGQTIDGVLCDVSGSEPNNVSVRWEEAPGDPGGGTLHADC